MPAAFPRKEFAGAVVPGRVDRTWRPRLVLVAVSMARLLPVLTAEETPTSVELDFKSGFTAYSSLAPGNAKVAQSFYTVDVTVPLAGTPALGLGVDLIAERDEFRFRNFAGFLAGKSAPLSGATAATIQPTLICQPNRQWLLVASGTIQSSGADGAPFADSVLVAGSLAATYQAGDSLRIGLGVQLAQRMNSSPMLLPFPIIDWHFAGRWALTALDGESGRLAYAVSDHWTVFGQSEFVWRETRLGRSSSIPSGIMRYEAFPLSLGIECKVGRHLTATIYAGEAVAQQFHFKDEHGQTLRTSAVHSPMIASLEFDYTF